MPDLPTITGIPQAQFDRIVSSFPGATPADKAQNYRNWLINRVLDQVERVEMHRAQASIRTSLPNRPPEPDFGQ